MDKQNTLKTLLLAITLALDAAAAIEASDISYPVVSIICGLFLAFKFMAGAVASLVLVWAAIKYIGSVDDPGARKYSKDVLRYVLIGLMLILLSEVLVIYVAPQRPDIMACSAWCTLLKC